MPNEQAKHPMLKIDVFLQYLAPPSKEPDVYLSQETAAMSLL